MNFEENAQEQPHQGTKPSRQPEGETDAFTAPDGVTFKDVQEKLAELGEKLEGASEKVVEEVKAEIEKLHRAIGH